jgi:hypothetical protein
VEHDHFGPRAGQNTSVSENHPAKMRFGNLAYTQFFEFPLVAARNPQLQKPAKTHERK